MTSPECRRFKTNLSLGQSIVNVAIDAGKAIEDLLIEMKAKLVQASQSGLDTDSYTALNQEFTSLRAQIEAIVASAEFNGKNLIDSAATNLDILSTVDGSTITITKQVLDATSLTIHTAALTDSTVAGTALTAISQAIIAVSNTLAALGSSAKRVDIQTEFTGKLQDILKQGVGNLVDAGPGAEKRHIAGPANQAAVGCSGTGHRQRRAPEHPGPVRLKSPEFPHPPWRAGFRFSASFFRTDRAFWGRVNLTGKKTTGGRFRLPPLMGRGRRRLSPLG